MMMWVALSAKLDKTATFPEIGCYFMKFPNISPDFRMMEMLHILYMV